jgi:hypothetical protein
VVQIPEHLWGETFKSTSYCLFNVSSGLVAQLGNHPLQIFAELQDIVATLYYAKRLKKVADLLITCCNSCTDGHAVLHLLQNSAAPGTGFRISTLFYTEPDDVNPRLHIVFFILFFLVSALPSGLFISAFKLKCFIHPLSPSVRFIPLHFTQ